MQTNRILIFLLVFFSNILKIIKKFEYDFFLGFCEKVYCQKLVAKLMPLMLTISVLVWTLSLVLEETL